MVRIVEQLAALLIAGGVLMVATPAQAQQWIDCIPSNPPPALVRIPELVAAEGKLRATIILGDEQQRLTFRQPPQSKPGQEGTSTNCAAQYVRTFRGLNAVPPPPANTGPYPDPLPGPTLRARVGDIVQLTLLNQINVADFGDSIDRGESNTGSGCDESTSGYPGPDKFPDCFHGSSTGNLHFHGTHTNPNSTGDNVFIEVRPSLRAPGGLMVTQQTVQDAFEQFFGECERRLRADPLAQWPRVWGDMPVAWTTEQERLLKQYDSDPEIGKKLWPVNEAQIRSGQWPQYYIGAFPYCYRLPDYTGLPANAPSPIMGQSPGTHWYHAHKHGSTAINVANGMTGAFIIEGRYDDDLNAFYGAGWTRTQPVMVINQLGVAPNLLRRGPGQTDKGPDFSVNGRLHPVVSMKPGEVQMWRILNTSGRAGAFFAGPPKGFEWRQLAQDGVQLSDVNYQSSLNIPLTMAAGNRVDLLIKAPTTPGTYPVMVQNMVDPSDLATMPLFTLVNVTVTTDPPVSGAQSQFIPKAPTFPAFLADIQDSEISGTKIIRFASKTPPKGPASPNLLTQHTIDGKKFDDQVGAVVLLNKVEEWKIVNETYGPPISHPFHIHINPFQVVEVFSPTDVLARDPVTGLPMIDPATSKPYPKYIFEGTPATVQGKTQCPLDPAKPNSWVPCDKASGGSPIWWDVFPIPTGTTVTLKNGTPLNVPGHFKMRSRFVDFSGLYVMHCHILAHEDRGMMTVVQVAPLMPPVRHH
jgi:FtsP/CotA-like multicopper oxidase with cupredoxin domain